MKTTPADDIVPKERRVQPRTRLRRPYSVRIVRPGAKLIYRASLMDVSVGGCAVATRAPIRPGETVTVAGEVRSDNLRTRIHAKAVVAYSLRLLPGIYRLGLRYRTLRWGSAGQTSLGVLFQLLVHETDTVIPEDLAPSPVENSPVGVPGPGAKAGRTKSSQMRGQPKKDVLLGRVFHRAAPSGETRGRQPKRGVRKGD